MKIIEKKYPKAEIKIEFLIFTFYMNGAILFIDRTSENFDFFKSEFATLHVELGTVRLNLRSKREYVKDV